MSYKFTPAGFEGLQQNINIANSATIGGLVDLNANIAATSTTTGTMTVFGGVGITGTTFTSILNVTGTGTYGGYTPIASYSSQVGIKFAGGSTTYGLAMQPVSDGTKALSVFNAANTYLGGINQTSTGITFIGDFSGNVSSPNVLVSSTNATTYTGTSASVTVPDGTNTTIRNISSTDNSYTGLMLQTSTAVGGSSINYIGSTNTGATFNPSLVFGRRSNTTAYSESMRLTGTGNLGVGTTTPNAKIEVRTDSNSYVNMLTLRNNISVTDGNSGSQIGFGVYSNIDSNAFGSIIRTIDVPGTVNGNASHGAHLTFLTTSDSTIAPTEKVRITGTGSIGVGTQSPQTAFQLGGDSNYRELRLRRSGDASTSQAIVFAKSRGTEAAPTTPNLNDALGTIVFAGWNGNTFTHGASITSFAANAHANTDTSGRLEFNTTPVGATGSALRMVINSTGNVGISSTAPDAKFQIGNVGNGNISTALVTSSESAFKLISRQGTVGASTVVGSIGVTNDTGGDNAMIKFYRGDTTAGGKIAFTSNDNTERMTIGNDGVVDIITATDSTNSSTGALTVSGGLGVASNVYVGNTVNANKMQSVGLSTTWGTTSGVNTGAFNSLMGAGAMATWLLSATSNGTFRSGIQSLDSTGDLRFYANANYIQFTANGSVSFPGIASFAGTTTSTDINTGTIVTAGGLGVSGNINSRSISTSSFTGRRSSPSASISGVGSTTGGTLPAGTYYAKVVAMVGTAWTEPSVQSAVVTTTGATSSITWTFAAVTDATSYKVYIGTTSNGQSYYFTSSGSPYVQTTVSGTVEVPKAWNSTGHILIPIGNTFTDVFDMVANTSPIRSIATTNTNTGGYVPLIEHNTTIAGGFLMHNVIGSYRTGSTYGGGIFLATGGNDNYPTASYLFGQAGAISHSGGTINFSNTTVSTTTSTGAVTVSGGLGVTGNIYAGAFYGAATGLTAIPGANITGIVTTTTNLSGGSIGTIPYQSAANTTVQLAVGTSGQVLTSSGAAAPSWTTLTMQNIPDAILKRSASVATTVNITLSAPQTIDGIAVIAGDRVLVKNQTTASQNGVYVVAAGAWTRATDADTAGEIANGIVGIDSGTQGGQIYHTTFKATDTLATTAMDWYEIYDSSSAATTNIANTLVLRDTNGSFAANVITSTTSNVTSTTVSTTTTTGALKVAGGVGVVGNIYAGAFYGAATGLTAIPAANISGTVATSTNLGGGSIGTIPYQSAANTTVQLAAGTAGQVLTSAGAAAPVWSTLTATGGIPDAKVATTVNITMSAPQTIDGIAVIAGERVLVKNQTTASQNGVYVVAAGAWTRSTDADTAAEIASGIVGVESGTTNGGLVYHTTFKSTDTLGTTAMNWYQVFDTSTSDSANTANRLVLRDANGSFAANVATVITSNVTSTTVSTSTTTGALKVAGGVGVVGNAYVGGTVVSGGVKFSGVSADTTTLDAYEEGTFTPVIQGTAVAGVGTYSIQQGKYTRIGNLVTFAISLSWTAHTGSGSLRLASLPFTATSTISSCPVNVIVSDLTYVNTLSAYISGNTNTISFVTQSSNATLANVGMDTAVSEMYINGTYFV